MDQERVHKILDEVTNIAADVAKEIEGTHLKQAVELRRAETLLLSIPHMEEVTE